MKSDESDDLVRTKNTAVNCVMPKIPLRRVTSAENYRGERVVGDSFSLCKECRAAVPLHVVRTIRTLT